MTKENIKDSNQIIEKLEWQKPVVTELNTKETRSMCVPGHSENQMLNGVPGLVGPVCS